MVRSAAFGFVLALGAATAAHAAPFQAPAAPLDSAIIQVGEGCGAGFWRGSGGACHPFNTPYGSNRGTTIECPPGFHIGEGRRACWPNK